MKKDTISIDDFAKVDIRVGLVTEAVPAPNSKKLIHLTVDMGADYGVVTILTGLLPHFSDPSVFVGNKYLFLANLAPRPMAGIESNGMFLVMGGTEIPRPSVVLDDTPLGLFIH